MESMELGQRKSERGFTLVELAIVMIIIGLLIGGILKGQELIANAQIGATVAQVKAIDAATTTFKDKYDALPGDMANVANRLTNCTGACNQNGNGNGRLAEAPLAAGAANGSETSAFFPMLSAADLIGGIANDGSAGWGNNYPEAKLPGTGFVAGYSPGGVIGANGAAAPGHYLTMLQDPGAVSGNALNANQGQRIDTKLDDGITTTGSVFVNAGSACIGAGNVYAENLTARACDLVIRFQN